LTAAGPADILRKMKKAFKTAAGAVTGLYFAVALTAYAKDQWTLRDLKSVDPAGRAMTSGEVDMARNVFGDAVDYTRVRIHKAPSRGGVAVTNGDDIYMELPALQTGDFSAAQEGPSKKKILMHELTHIWQHHALNRREKMMLRIRTVPDRVLFGLTGNDRMYKYDLQSGKNFMQMNGEQQASIIEHYAEAKATLASPLCAAGAVNNAEKIACAHIQARADNLLQKLLPALPSAGRKI
jgi:hypothetical protein